MISRRRLIGSLAAGSGALLLSGCDRLSNSPRFREALRGGEALSMRAQRLLLDRGALAREYGREDISPVFRPNGTRMPASARYAAQAANGFADWRLTVDGLVSRPLSLSLATIMAMPRRTQITRHDCVEGWSAIGEWTGVPLRLLLDKAGLRDGARYIVFHCADDLYGMAYYESIDLVDALHPQTIMAWALNRTMLPIPNGAPLRLRVERMLGYKHAKFVERIEAVASLDHVGGGHGGYWEDNADYEWYAGI
ncbi:MAG TPA: molybdopterin-dependent oxidoreductase [Sphingomonadaceae bacterium]|nr:molybdopterin-dependent oxidoreductase [Sphingomonadaceae bacterium]